MRTRLIHAALGVACVSGLRPAAAQEHTPPADGRPAPDLHPGNELNPEHVVGSILHDSSGRSWFGTTHGGVYRFDGRELTLFTRHDGLADNQVRSILEDPSGTVWFGTAKGISRIEHGVITTISDREYLSSHEWRIESGDLWFKSDGDFDFNTREGAPGAYRSDGTTPRHHAFPIDVDPAKRGDYTVTGIDQHKDGRVWFATYAVVIGFDGESFTIIDDASLGHTEDTGYLHARCVFEDSTGRVWIGNNGIGVVMREGETTINFTQAHGVGRRSLTSNGPDPDPRPGDAPAGQPALHRVFSIGEDRDGNIWFGTVDQGAWRYDGETLQQFTEEDGLDTDLVFAITTDRRGDLWVGGNGVFRFDGSRFERRF